MHKPQTLLQCCMGNNKFKKNRRLTKHPDETVTAELGVASTAVTGFDSIVELGIPWIARDAGSVANVARFSD